jgi:glucose dehydrogenase
MRSEGACDHPSGCYYAGAGTLPHAELNRHTVAEPRPFTWIIFTPDTPSQPTLADITVNGKTVPVIYAPAQTGNIFVLDRSNGKLVVPAPEKPVPQGAAKGDYVTKTQPFSDLSFRPKNTGRICGARPFDQLVSA